jgi:hypothetical protein
MLNRKDTSQELDRPHFYSQFWIDVAQGKRDLAATRAVEGESEVEDSDDEEFGIQPEPIVNAGPKPRATKAPEKKAEPPRPVISSLADLANIDLLMKSSAEMDTDEVPDIEAGAMDDLGPFGETTDTSEPTIITDFDLDDVESEPEAMADEDLDEESGDFDEEEEEDDWGSPRRSSKPQKPRRQPRERRGY